MVPVSMLQGAPRPVGRRIRRARGLLASINLRFASGSVKAGLGAATATRADALEIAGRIAVTGARDRAWATTRSLLRRPWPRSTRARSPVGSLPADRPDSAQMITEFGEERQRRLVLDYFGGEARLRIMRRAPTFGSPVFVVDFDRGARHFRTLGSFGSSVQVTEQSSMDMMYPARLVFHYERLMSLALAMSRQAVNALLLGVGGAAMWRFMRAYLPDCAADPGRCRRDRRRHRPPLVLSDPAGHHRAGAAIRRRHHRALRRDPRRSLQFVRAGRQQRGVLGALPRRLGAGRRSRQQLGRFLGQPGGAGRCRTRSPPSPAAAVSSRST